MPVPQSWYPTNRKIRSPSVTRVAADARNSSVARTRGYRRWPVASLVQPAVRRSGRTVRRLRPEPAPVLGACCTAFAFGRPSACSGGFPRSPAPISTSTRARSCCLTGPNGAGKTTLLRLCAGLLPLRSGEAEVLGIDLATTGSRSAGRSSLVGHETFCYDDLTVTENLRFAARAVGAHDGRRRRRPRAGRAATGRRRDARAAVAGSAPAPLARGGARARSAAALARRTARRPRRPRSRRARSRRAGRAERRSHGAHRVARARPRAPHRHARGATGCAVKFAVRHVSLRRRTRDDGPRCAARRGQGPAHRVAFARRAAADRAVRGDRRGAVRVRARLRPHGARHAPRPGLFWATVLLAALLAVGRSFAVEETNRARDGLRLSGLDGGSIFLGKAAAIAVELFLLEIVLGVAVVVLYDVDGARGPDPAARGGGRDHRTGRHRYGLRRARRGAAGPRNAHTAARPAGRHARDARWRRARSKPRSTTRRATRGRGCSCWPRSRFSSSRPGSSRSGRCWRKRESGSSSRPRSWLLGVTVFFALYVTPAAPEPGLRSGTAALPPRAVRVACVPRVRRHRARVDAVAGAADAQPDVGPARRRVRRSRRDLHRA